MIYQWRYQVPTDVAEAQPTQLEREARKAAVRDAKHDGWAPTSPLTVRTTPVRVLENVTEVVVEFSAVRACHLYPQEFHSNASSPTYLPAQPLVDLVEGRSIRQTFTEAQWRAYYRGRSSGRFTLDAADKLAIALGHTLETVWLSDVLSRPSDTVEHDTEEAA